MSLRTRHGLLVALFVVGRLAIGYCVITFDERIAVLLPGAVIISFRRYLFDA
jgi:hypothetical protein